MIRDGVGQAVMIAGVEGVREALELRKAIPAQVVARARVHIHTSMHTRMPARPTGSVGPGTQGQ